MMRGTYNVKLIFCPLTLLRYEKEKEKKLIRQTFVNSAFMLSMENKILVGMHFDHAFKWGRRGYKMCVK